MSCSAANRRFAAFGLIPFPMPSETPSSTYRPPAVACAAIWTSDARRPTFWYGASGVDEFAPYLQRRDVRRLVQQLGELAGRGYTLLTWDAMRSDWDLLASQAQDRVFCRQLASQHVDMVFHVVCARGHSRQWPGSVVHALALLSAGGSGQRDERRPTHIGLRVLGRARCERYRAEF